MTRCADAAAPAGGEAGFSLLEAIVALAVIATALLPLYALQQRTTELALRVEEAGRLDGWWRTALPEALSINPMLRCEGESDYGEFVLSWTCSELAPVTRNAVPASAVAAMQRLQAGEDPEEAMRPLPGSFDVGLYEFELTVTGRSEAVSASRTIRRLGWRRRVPIDPNERLSPR